MQLQRALLGLLGVLDAGVVMATQANWDHLDANHLLPESIPASPDDLLIVVKTENDLSATETMNQFDSLPAKGPRKDRVCLWSR